MAFENAPKAPTKKSTSKKDRPEVEQGDVVSKLGWLKIMRAMITAAEESLGGDFKDTTVTDYLVTTGLASNTVPENYDAINGKDKVGVQIKKRSSASVLTDDEVAILALHNIPVADKIVTEETYRFNPDYVPGGAKYDADLFDRIAKRMEGTKGWNNEIIQKVEGEVLTITSDDTLPALFKLTDPAIVKMLLPIAGTLAISPKAHIEANNLIPIIEGVAEILGLPTMQKTVYEAANDPDATLSAKKEKKAKTTKRPFKKAEEATQAAA